MTNFEVTDYTRNPFVVQAVKVTEDNMDRVATWCGGTVETPEIGPRFVKVGVNKPLNAKQTQAFVGTWVLKQAASFKVYTEKAFTSNFSLGDNLPKPDTDMFTRIETPIYDALLAAGVISYNDGSHKYLFQAGDTGTLTRVGITEDDESVNATECFDIE